MAHRHQSSKGLRAVNEEGRKGSIIAGQYVRGERVVKEELGTIDVYPANEEIAKAVQQKVAAAVEMARKYRHVGWYASFVAAYMIILYFQASAYKSGEVVQTLKQAFLEQDDEGVYETSMTFRSGEELLDYLGTKVLLPIWQDPVCGDGTCQQPWEFPAWGRFGCQPDCGFNRNTTSISLSINADFTRHPSISARTLMSAARYNLCYADPARRNRGEADLCWFEEDMIFTDTQPQVLHRMDVVNGEWYVSVKGDFTGRVQGQVHQLPSTGSRETDDPSASTRSSFTTLDDSDEEQGNTTRRSTDPIFIQTQPVFNNSACRSEDNGARRLLLSTSPTVRRLLNIHDKAREVGGHLGLRMMEDAIQEAKSLIKRQQEQLEQANSKAGSASLAPP